MKTNSISRMLASPERRSERRGDNIRMLTGVVIDSLTDPGSIPLVFGPITVLSMHMLYL